MSGSNAVTRASSTIEVEHKRRLEAEKKQAKVDHELVWANNIKAAINAQRGRELRVRERERAIVHGRVQEREYPYTSVLNSTSYVSFFLPDGVFLPCDHGLDF